jgi:hypothetical protein
MRTENTKKSVFPYVGKLDLFVRRFRTGRPDSRMKAMRKRMAWTLPPPP